MSDAHMQPAKLLRRALFLNAGFSMLCALVFLVQGSSVAAWVGTTRDEITQTAVSLLLFVGLILLVATRRALESAWPFRGATLIAVMDILWVVTSPIRIASYTTAGKLTFGFIALVVLGFAIVQVYALTGLIRARRAANPEARADVGQRV